MLVDDCPIRSPVTGAVDWLIADNGERACNRATVVGRVIAPRHVHQLTIWWS